MSLKRDLHEDRESYIDDKGERIPSHRYRAIRDGINEKPAQDLKDDPEVIRVLNHLDELERRTRPSLGANVRGKDFDAYEAIQLAAGLFDYVVGWAIDNQRGMAQRGERSDPHEMFLRRESAGEDHSLETQGALRQPLDPVQARRFLFNLLHAMGPRIVPNDIAEAIEALDYGETLPIFQKLHTTKRTGLIEQRAKLQAIAFIEYESQKGIRKHVSVEKVMEAFAVTRDSVKDWKAELRVALGALRVDLVLNNARNAGEAYADELRQTEKVWEPHVFERFEELYGKPGLLEAAKRYKARSKKGVKGSAKKRG
ncbi:hypothetical protein ABIF66_002396 [Bradyrhizobium japonicum]